VRVGLVLEQCLAPVPGGTGRYSRELAAALARRAPSGASVVGVTAWHRSLSAAVVAGVEGPRRLVLPRRPLIAAWQRGLGPGGQGDVVHAPTPLAPPRRRRPLVVTVHDAVPWTHPETLTPRGVRWHRTAVERAARTADLVVVPTNAVADELRRHVPLRADRLRVVGHGVSSDLAVPVDAEERARRLELPERYLLTVATLEPRKGLSVLLAALASPEAPDLPLLVVGQPGWGGLDPLAEAARLGLGDRVRVLGRVPDADLAVLLDRATALVVPSRAEGFGLPLLEGMAAGTPVITSPDPALVEVGGGAALAAEDAELARALRQVAEDAQLRARMVAAGRERASSYSWDGAADQMWQSYDDIT
jgi:glycosyltransferase involved in cell wall biosynthesis